MQLLKKKNLSSPDTTVFNPMSFIYRSGTDDVSFSEPWTQQIFFFVIKGFNRTNRESVFSVQLTKGRSCDSLEAFKISKCREKES